MPWRRRLPWILSLLLLGAFTPASGSVIPDPGDTGPTNLLLNSWSFTDTTNWVSDYGYPPVSFTNLSSSTLGDGAAVVVDGTNAAWLQYRVLESDGSTNLTMDQGSVTLWVAPYWSGTNQGGSGPGEWSRLIEAGTYTTNASYGWWSLYTDPEGVNLYFAAQTNDGSQAIYLSAPIAWTTNRWHWLALTYSTNSALYVDGELATNGPPVTYWPGPEAVSNGFFIGSASDGTAQAHGMIDAVVTYANPLDAGTIHDIFWSSLVPYDLNPCNWANISSAPSYITNTPTFRAISGAGYVQYLGPASTCVTNSGVWMTDVSASPNTNGTLAIFFTIMGGDTNALYDVLATGQLPGNGLTNAPFVWLGQGSTCSRYTITNLPAGSCYLVLGTPQDSDQDGLPDALELLWTKTDPHNPDTDGDGIWDWFGAAYFRTNGVDPWADPAGDGWNNLEKFLYGLDPGVFCTPPAPRNLVVSLNQSTWTATLSWQPPSGAVTGYTLYRWDYLGYEPVVFQLGVTNRFVDTSFPPYTSIASGPYWYDLVAHYVQGDSATASSADVPSGGLSVYMLAGPLGSTLMRATHVPAGATGLRLTMFYDDFYANPSRVVLTNFTFSLSGFTNGFFTLPQAWTVIAHDSQGYLAQAVWPDGSVGEAVLAAGEPAPPFYDGRAHLAQNLAFVLRAADVAGPPFLRQDNPGGAPFPHVFPSSYAFASAAGGGWDGSCLGATLGSDHLGPFEDNWLYRNFVFAGTDLEYLFGSLNTGIDWDDADGDLVPPSPQYVFQMPTNGLFPTFLSAAETTWIMPHTDPSLLDLYTTANLFTVQNNVLNWYGLRLLSVEFTSPGPYFLTCNPGQSVGRTNSYFFGNFEQPSLSTAGYVFGGFNNDGSSAWQGPLPGDAAFTPTNAQPLLVASLGSSYEAVAYARQTIVNGDQSKPAYLGQYFETALAVDTNGVITTNQAGTLSPYGVFVPTEPGAAALVTMTNWGVNERGTGMVYVVALATDANHDGVIDSSMFGPDYTTYDHPFRFWVNDCNDLGDDQGNGIPGQGDGGTGLFLFQAYSAVPGTRALVNFFPVQVHIQSLLKALPSLTSLQFILRQSESALYYLETDLTPDHCHDYLTDTNFLGSLPSYMGSASRVWNSGVALSTNFLAKIRDQGKGIILVEAGQATGSPLVLEVWQGTNQLAQASLYLSISGVEQMFRQKNLIRETFPSTTEFPGFPDRLADGDVPNEPETNDKNFVFLHGYNVDPDHARGTFADVFKRLYWSGSHAKFYGVTWFGNDSQKGGAITMNYHTNVYHAFQSATNLAVFLGSLTNGPTVVAAHSLGNMVALDALSECNARMDQLFMIDAAVPIEAVQGNAQWTSTMYYSDWQAYVDRLNSHEWYNLFTTGDGRSGLGWGDRLADFHSTDVYNFYSSGEEVLRSYSYDPPADILSASWTIASGYLLGQSPVSSYAWVWQEKGKGRAFSDELIGSTHGGWRFNSGYDTNGAHLPNAQASLLSSSQLMTNAFFDVSGPAPWGTNYDRALLGVNGSGYAQTNRNRILSDAIPALTLPVGANPVPRLSPPLNSVERNFDMQVLYENAWPSDRPQQRIGASAAGEWWHSDFRQAAYTFTYKLFNTFVDTGDLK